MRFIWIAAIIFLSSCASKKSADLIITGGPIYTNNPDFPVVEAVVVSGDTIQFAGTETEALLFQSEKTQIINLGGKMMTPGFIEGHGHIMGLGYNEMNLDLMGMKNFDAIVEAVRKKASESKPGEWIIGRGWHQDKWDKKPVKMVKGFPTHDMLTAAAPNNPVALSHASGHNILVNMKAMQMAGINATSREKIEVPVGGEIIRDELGNPTGLFNETAEDLIHAVIPAASEESERKALELAIAACQRNGITSFQTAGENQKVIDLIEKFKKENHLGVRM